MLPTDIRAKQVAWGSRWVCGGYQVALPFAKVGREIINWYVGSQKAITEESWFSLPIS